MNVENPPAFPEHENVNDPRADGFVATHGMTLRDYFAGQALVGLLAQVEPEFLAATEWSTKKLGQVVSAGAYDIADGMLKERQTRMDKNK
jgi:hypothetical protein